MDIDRNAPSTKGDLLDVEARINERHEMLRAEMGHTYADLKETMRDIQTELLKAFYSFGQSNSKRMIEIEGNEAALRSRVATLEDRVMEIEKRLNIPPIQ
jgi:hypothetical protein